jgi:hypothetical protein
MGNILCTPPYASVQSPKSNHLAARKYWKKPETEYMKSLGLQPDCLIFEPRFMGVIRNTHYYDTHSTYCYNQAGEKKPAKNKTFVDLAVLILNTTFRSSYPKTYKIIKDLHACNVVAVALHGNKYIKPTNLDELVDYKMIYYMPPSYTELDDTFVAEFAEVQREQRDKYEKNEREKKEDREKKERENEREKMEKERIEREKKERERVERERAEQERKASAEKTLFELLEKQRSTCNSSLNQLVSVEPAEPAETTDIIDPIDSIDSIDSIELSENCSLLSNLRQRR